MRKEALFDLCDKWDRRGDDDKTMKTPESAEDHERTGVARGQSDGQRTCANELRQLIELLG